MRRRLMGMNDAVIVQTNVATTTPLATKSLLESSIVDGSFEKEIKPLGLSVNTRSVRFGAVSSRS